MKTWWRMNDGILERLEHPFWKDKRPNDEINGNKKEQIFLNQLTELGLLKLLDEKRARGDNDMVIKIENELRYRRNYSLGDKYV